MPWDVDAGVPRLEVMRRRPRMPRFRPPLVFVHGAFVSAACWDVHFLPWFASRGFTALAPSLRGHGGSEGELRMAGIMDYVRDLERAVESLDEPPVLIGHSMGGLVVQRYLERHSAAAAVLLASVPPAGLMQSTLRLMLSDPLLCSQIGLMQGFGPAAMDQDIACRAIFSDHVPPAELREYSRFMQAESQRAIWDMTAGALPRPWRVERLPMLVIGAGDDALFTAGESERTARAYGAELYLEPGMAHAMMLEPGWEAVAGRIEEWLLRRLGEAGASATTGSDPTAQDVPIAGG